MINRILIKLSVFQSKKSSNKGISSGGGVLLLRETDIRLGITNELAKMFPDKRDARSLSDNYVDLPCN